MRSWLFPDRAVRSTEATLDQVIATGSGGPTWGGLDPLDGDGPWRVLGRSRGGGRSVPYWTREKARAYSVTAWRSNPMARAIVDTYCVDAETEILTTAGWRRYNEVQPGTDVLTLNHETGMSEWQPVLSMHVFPAERRQLVRLRTRDHSSLSTGDHRWPVLTRRRKWQGNGWNGHTETRGWRTSDTLEAADWLIRAAPPADAPCEAKWADDFVELVAWTYTEGHIRDSGALILTQSLVANPDLVARIDAVLRRLYGPPSASLRRGTAQHLQPRWLRVEHGDNARFKLSREAAEPVLLAAPDKVPSSTWLRDLTLAQLRLFIDVSLMADGDSLGLWPAERKRGCHFAQKDLRRSEAFQFALILAGIASSIVTRSNDGHHTVSVHKKTGTAVVRATEVARRVGSKSAVRETIEHDGIVWCPRTANGTWFARRDGTSYFTGNTAFAVGDSGVSCQVTNPDVQQVVNEFWTDPANYILPRRQDLFLRDQMLLGETFLELMQGPSSGAVRFSPTDPGWITDVTLRSGNALWPEKVLFRWGGEEGSDREFTVAAMDDATGLRDGEAMFWTPWKTLLTDTRSMPFLTPVLDWLDSYDTVLSNLIDRTALARYLVWDVTLAGAKQPDIDNYIAARGGTWVPKSGTVEVHNDTVKWEPKSVSSGAFEDLDAAQGVLTAVAGGSGLAKHWLAEPEDANRATGLTMAEPVRRRVAGLQTTWLGYQTELVRFAVDRAVAAGRLSATVTATDPKTGTEIETPASQSVTVTGPEVAIADAQVTAQVLLNLSTGLKQLVEVGVMSPEAARVAARKGWEDYVGVPYSADLDSPEANPDDVAGAVDDAKLRAVRPA